MGKRKALDARTLRAVARVLRIDARWWDHAGQPGGASACIHNACRFDCQARAIESTRKKAKRG
jgi:hypothetical protein